MTTPDNKNQANWEAIYSEKKTGHHMSYPSEQLVRLFFRNKPFINTKGVCLEFGFGSANNSEFLIQQMSQLYGLEISESSVQIARSRLAKFNNFQADKFCTDQTMLADEFFDIVVAWQVLCYNNASSLASAIDSPTRSLKPQGIFIGTLTTTRDIKTHLAKKIGHNTYEIDHRIAHQEGCQVYAPSNEQEFLQLFEGLNVIDYGYFECVSRMEENSNSEFFIVAKKA